MNRRIKELMEASKQVILDCSLKNGALVAANSKKSYYPPEAKYYRYVWPRDGGYIIMAANILGLNIQHSFFRWLEGAEGWEKNGLFYEKYHPNGKKAAPNYQPDQAGSVLTGLHDYIKTFDIDYKRYKHLIKHTANGLCKVWDKTHFTRVTQDLWEERYCFPDLDENFSYSLASCAKGLECASELYPNQEEWMKTAAEMKTVLLNNHKEYFSRSWGKLPDKRVDASLVGICWPCGIVSPTSPLMKNTVAKIEADIVRNTGVFRYEHDEYDGWMDSPDIHRKKGAGYWPLLNFWMAIYFHEAKNNTKALEYFNKVLDDLEKKNQVFIPEQVFDNDIQVAVSPLCWSHAMFVIAARKLGLIKVRVV